MATRNSRKQNWKRFGAIAVATLSGLALFVPAIRAQEISSPQATVAPTAGVPYLLELDGTLRDAAARALVGENSVTFAVYAENQGGSALWSETQRVTADANGHYHTILGRPTANRIPATLFGTGDSRWLGISVAHQEESARVLLASVPYALKAGDAETLGGLPSSAYVTAKSLAASTARATVPVISGSAAILATPQSAAPQASPDAIPQATPSGTGTPDYIPVWTSSSVLGSSKIFQDSTGNVGIATSKPQQTLDVSGNSIFRGSFQLPPGHEAIASTGYESHSFQFEASSYNAGTGKPSDKSYGFRAEPLGNNTANPSAKLDLFFGSANGTLTDTGFSWASNGIVTFVPKQIFNGTSETITGALNLPDTVGLTGGSLFVGGLHVGDQGSTSNTFVGEGSGVSVGVVAGEANNTAVGEAALIDLTTGGGNTAVGNFTLHSLQTGSNESVFGSSNQADVTGIGATTLGNEATTSPNGTYGTAIGYQASANPNFANATAIGGLSIVNAKNAIGIGSYAVAMSVGIGTAHPRQGLEVASSANGTDGVAINLSNTSRTTSQSGFSIGMNLNPTNPTDTANTPGAQFLALDTGMGTSDLVLQAKQPGQSSMNPTFFLDYAGNATVFGNLHANGKISKAGGSFKIDDPIAPTTKFLSHSFVESPDMKNIYDGVVVLDAKGEATVTLPDWFDALNTDFRYQLSCVGKPGRKPYVAEEMQANHFKIAGGRPGTKVSWQVTGTRQDAWAKANRIPTEELKPADEQGRYLHPELYGAPASLSVRAAHDPAVRHDGAALAAVKVKDGAPTTHAGVR